MSVSGSRPDTEIVLEELCPNCDGGGGWWVNGTAVEHWTDCDRCNASGYVPTIIGGKVLDLIRHNMIRLMVRPRNER